MTLDDILTSRQESLPPRVKFWRQMLSEPDTSAVLSVNRFPGGMGSGLTTVDIEFSRRGQPFHVDSVPWDDELNAGLINHLPQIRGIDEGHEASRFALGLRAALRYTERQYGDGFFNSVLIDLLQESDLTTYPEIAQVVKFATALGANRASRNYDNCRETIAVAISGRYQELVQKLDYTPQESKRIITLAIARYVDERFTVSSRRAMGLL